MQANDPNFWSNTLNYVDVGIHNRLTPTVYDSLTVTYQLVKLPTELGGQEELIESISGDCTYEGTEVVAGVTKYIYRCTFAYAMTDGAMYAIDLACDSIDFGKRIAKQAKHY